MGFFRPSTIEDKIELLKELIYKIVLVEIHAGAFIYLGVFSEKLAKARANIDDHGKLDFVTLPQLLEAIISFNFPEIKLVNNRISKFIDIIYLDRTKNIFNNNPKILGVMEDLSYDINQISNLKAKVEDSVRKYEQQIKEVEMHFNIIDFNITRLEKYYKKSTQNLSDNSVGNLSRLLLVPPYGGYLDKDFEELELSNVNESELWAEILHSIDNYQAHCGLLVNAMSKDSEELKTTINQLFDTTIKTKLMSVYNKLKLQSDDKIFKEHLSEEIKGFTKMLSANYFNHERINMSRKRAFTFVENVRRKSNI